ncbi:MAG: hypothetical protein KDK66_00745, partial [Deltaproteobacteria bacterium]|nr:hypothetical protein [Deltaproteobacteria bacterium]
MTDSIKRISIFLLIFSLFLNACGSSETVSDPSDASPVEVTDPSTEGSNASSTGTTTNEGATNEEEQPVLVVDEAPQALFVGSTPQLTNLSP